MSSVITREHGSTRGYNQHISRKEKPCEACKQANRTYHRNRYAAMVAEKKRKAEEVTLPVHELITLRPEECLGLTGACTCELWSTRKKGSRVAFMWHLRDIKAVKR